MRPRRRAASPALDTLPEKLTVNRVIFQTDGGARVRICVVILHYNRD